MIKSNDLVVGKLVRIGNMPVSQDLDKKEDEHLRHILENLHEQEQQRRQQQKFEGHMRALIQAMPEAFHFTQAQTETGPQGQRLIDLKFEPAGDFKPASTELEVLRGLVGTVTIDEAKKQIVRLEAQLFRDVDFGWGILIHLNKGGKLALDREPTDGTACNIRAFSINADGRVLLLKKLQVHWSFDHFACFRHSLSLASAVAMLTAPNFSLHLRNQAFPSEIH